MSNFNFNRNPVSETNGNQESWRSAAFINIRMNTKSGKSKQIGRIDLKHNDPIHMKLLEKLQSVPSDELDSALEKLIMSCDLSFVVVDDEARENDEFDLDL